MSKSRMALLAALAIVCASAAASPLVSGPEAGQWLIQTWEVENGLPENSATAMVQTPDGYLWLGTFNGLVRFDGVKFDVFNPENTPQLPSASIVNLHLDQQGRLWVSTLQGLVVREGTRWRLIRQPETPDGDYIRTFTERQTGELLLTTFDGKILEFAKGNLVRLPTPPGEAGEGYQGGVDEAGQWWVAQHGFIGRWDGNSWVPTVSGADLAGLGSGAVGCGAARDGGLWLVIGPELRKYSHQGEVARRKLQESPGGFWSLFEDSRSNLWISTFDRGFCQIDPGGELRRWEVINGVTYHGVRFVGEDREKNLWVGTSGLGLMRLKQRRFESFGIESGLLERVVKSAWPASDGGIWVGTYGEGLFRWTEDGITRFPLPGWTKRNLYLQSVLSDRAGRTWVGSYGSGLFMFDDHGSRQFPVTETGGNNIIALFEDSHRRVWISGGNGISVYDGEALRAYGPPDGLPPGGVCCFAEDTEGVLWLSNRERVYRLEKASFREVRTEAGRSLGAIVCLKSEPDGTMWLGSLEAGLLRWRRGAVAAVGPEAGLPVRSVHSILEDGQGCFWLGSNRGVVRVEQRELDAVADGKAKTLNCQLLDKNDGLPSVECTGQQQPVCCRDAWGRLWFATVKGLAMIDPARFRANTVAPRANIEEVVFHAAAHGPKGLVNRRLGGPFSSPPELPAGSHGIEIHYTAPSFSSPEKERFQVNLDGTENDWQDFGARRVAFFDELQPGQHVFRVRAANDDGLWNETGASLAFTVLPFFWQTVWFRVLAVAIVCATAAAGFYRRVARLRASHKAVEAFTHQLILSQENERKRVAAELHDGLGQDLLLIKNRLGLLSVTAQHPQEVTRQLEVLSATASRAMGEVRSISQALRPAALEQVGLTKAIEWMIEQIGEVSSTKFSSEIENIDRLLTTGMEINLYRIVQEGLNNVLKHSQATNVIVEIKRRPPGILVSILDDGRGFEAQDPQDNGAIKPGFGLAGMRERAKLLSGQIELQSARGTGTRLTLNVPTPGSGGPQ